MVRLCLKPIEHILSYPIIRSYSIFREPPCGRPILVRRFGIPFTQPKLFYPSLSVHTHSPPTFQRKYWTGGKLLGLAIVKYLPGDHGGGGGNVSQINLIRLFYEGVYRLPPQSLTVGFGKRMGFTVFIQWTLFPRISLNAD